LFGERVACDAKGIDVRGTYGLFSPAALVSGMLFEKIVHSGNSKPN